MLERMTGTRLPQRADVVVIGGGVVGCAIARELSRYALTIVLLERAPDVASGTSKANSGILHAGFDAEPGTWKARLNVRGSRLYQSISEELGIPRRRVGSLVVARDESQLGVVEQLRRRGVENGLTGLALWRRDEVLSHEPNLSPDVAGALWAPTAAIVCPFLATIALAENAIRNGVRVITECAVTGVEVVDHATTAVETELGRIETRFVVNAAGVHSGDVARMAGDESFTIKPRRGEYILFDRSVGDLGALGDIPDPEQSVQRHSGGADRSRQCLHRPERHRNPRSWTIRRPPTWVSPKSFRAPDELCRNCRCRAPSPNSPG